MSEQKIFEIPASAKEKAWIDNDTYLTVSYTHLTLPTKA